MSIDVLKAICLIRGEESPDFVETESNPYRVSVRDKNIVTSYMFSAPIRTSNGEISNNPWENHGEDFEFEGTTKDSRISVTRSSIVLKKPRQRYSLTFEEDDSFKIEKKRLIGEYRDIESTTCGVKVTMSHIKGSVTTLQLKSDNVITDTRYNSQYFSFLERDNRPFVTVAAMFFISDDGEYYPLKLINEKIDDHTYLLHMEPFAQIDGRIVFEFNMYEDKLLQDTTVSEAMIWENNAFGCTAFIGRTDMFGDQWLYSKTTLVHLEEYFTNRILSIRLLIPKISKTCPRIEGYRMDEQFCSLGSSWENKVTHGDTIVPIYDMQGYIALDLTDTMSIEGRLVATNGVVIKAVGNETGFGVLSTSDSYAMPQILEIVTAG